MNIEQGKRYLLEDGTATDVIQYSGWGEKPTWDRKRILCPLDEWIEHDGGECPVPAAVLVGVRVQSGIKSSFRHLPSWWGDQWRRSDDPFSITHYRIPSSQFDQGERDKHCTCGTGYRVHAEHRIGCELNPLTKPAEQGESKPEPAVSDAAWRALQPWGGTRERLEKEKNDDGLVLRTRAEWEQRNSKSITEALQDRACLQVRVIGQDAELAALRDEAETLRLQLAACGVAALGHFTGCDPKYDSASLQDVLRMQAELDRLRKGLKEAQRERGMCETCLAGLEEANERLAQYKRGQAALSTQPNILDPRLGNKQ